MSKDGIQAFADEVTLLRYELDRLQRTSLDKREAEALHEILVGAVQDMLGAVDKAPRALQGALKADRDQMARTAIQAATEAAERVMGEIRGELAAERRTFAQAAGEARRAAWRSFGGFWVWLAAMLALGAFLGLLAAHVTETGRTLASVKSMVPYACDWAILGGTRVEKQDGSSFCAFWITTPAQAKAQ